MNKYPKIHDNNDVLKYRIGFEFMDNIFNTETELGEDLKNIYEFKKIAKDVCKNKKYMRDSNKIQSKIKNIDVMDINKQNREIADLYEQIDKLSNELSY